MIRQTALGCKESPAYRLFPSYENWQAERKWDITLEETHIRIIWQGEAKKIK
jgi:hypothetical protein